MDINSQIKLLENRLAVLSASDKENQGVCRRVERDIRNLKKKLNKGVETV